MHFLNIDFNKREELEEKCKKSNVRADTMEKLSRTLQAERNTLKEQLKQFTAPNEVESKQNETVTTSTDIKQTEAANQSGVEVTSSSNSEVKEVANNENQSEDSKSNESAPASTVDEASNKIEEPIMNSGSPSKKTTHIDETAISN